MRNTAEIRDSEKKTNNIKNLNRILKMKRAISQISQ
jgi:hypothetical protein